MTVKLDILALWPLTERMRALVRLLGCPLLQMVLAWTCCVGQKSVRDSCLQSDQKDVLVSGFIQD